MGRLLARLPHMAAHPERHLFLLTHSCGQCHRKPCAHCAAWHRANHSAVVRLAATLGTCNPMPSSLQPYAIQPATLCHSACNPMSPGAPRRDARPALALAAHASDAARGASSLHARGVPPPQVRP
eukprot:scaffold71397_cov60-Phaeocystis_antarctica.AAC.9